MAVKLSSIFDKLETNARYQYGLLAIITLLAAVLRFYKLGEWSFWIDEIYTIDRALAQFPSVEAMIGSIRSNSYTFPISLVLTGGALSLLGVGEWSARLVPAMIGVISIPVLYFPIKRLFSPAVGLLTSLLLAVSPWHIYWSQNARFYTSLMLFYSLALFTCFRGLERDRPSYFLSFLVLLYLAVSERSFALFMVPVVVCFLLVLEMAPFEKPSGLRARNVVLLALPAIAFGILEIYGYVTSGSSMIVSALNINEGQVNHSPFRLLASIVYRTSIPLICLGTLGGAYLLDQRKRAGIFLCSAAWVPPVALILIAPFVFTVDRYAFVSLPFWIILSAVAAHQLLVRADKVGKLLSLGVLLLLIADPLSEDVLYYLYQNGNRPDWRGAFAVVDREKDEGDLVVTTRPDLGRYYLDPEVGWINDMDPDVITRAGARVWFVIDEAGGWVVPELEEWIRENSELIDVLRVSMPGKSLDISIYFYDPARASPSSVLSG
jgi:mannosyltransferase